MIGGIGAIQFKTAVDGAESASPNLLQGGVGTQASEGVGSTFAEVLNQAATKTVNTCLLYTSPSPRDGLLSRMPSSA